MVPGNSMKQSGLDDMASTLPSSMLAARVNSYATPPRFEQQEVALPQIGNAEVLIRVTAAGLCHTDIGVPQGHKANEGSSVPMTAGHEPAGIIVAIGSQVERFKVGDRVGFVNHKGSCGRCDECTADPPRSVYCLSSRTRLRGVNDDGCFAQYAVGDERFTFKLPAGLSDEEAAPLMCAGVTSYSAILSAAVEPGQWLAVVGCGGLGHLVVQFAKAMGIKVLAIDVRDEPLQLVKQFGADFTLNSHPDNIGQHVNDVLSEIDRKTGGGVHGAILLAENQQALEFASDITRKHGTVCLVAVPPDPWLISPLYVVHKDLRYTGTLLANPDVCEEMLSVVEKYGIRVHTKTYPFRNIAAMVQDYLTGATLGRLVMTFDDVGQS